MVVKPCASVHKAGFNGYNILIIDEINSNEEIETRFELNNRLSRVHV